MLTVEKKLCKNGQGYLFLFIPKLFQKQLWLSDGDKAKMELRRDRLTITITKKNT